MPASDARLAALPDLLTFSKGARLTRPEQWPARRAELLEDILTLQYGHLPPAPATVSASLLHPYSPGNHPEARCAHYRLTAQPCGFSFLVFLMKPAGEGPFPAIVDGDACWRGLTDEILLGAVRRGYAVAVFNRVEIVPDSYSNARDEGLYRVHPDGDYGALAAWAWGFHRVVDFLMQCEDIDRGRIAVTGHSRGGKAALLAGATDGRVALTAPNNSGCGGAGCYRFPDEKGERIEDILRAIPYWFTPRFKEYVGRVEALPFDQHSVKALVAPRALLTTEARGDLWASPRGTRLTHEAAREVFRLLGAETRIGLWYRDGGHAHGPADWEALLDFADLQFFGRPARRSFDMEP
ncbi:MAG: hypothetical protein BWZ02_02291 [Lentisphaerae bacterium ADurb.BinA184]|nr:MAG: hypothetical protein BWZ02_02291 [Lentisphaerae bacterium ADurb.BinA184]